MAAIYLIVIIQCDDPSGHNFPLLRHFFRHYLSCGIQPENVRTGLCGTGATPEIQSYLEELSLNFTKFDLHESNGPALKKIRQTLQKDLPPEAWIIAPDLEEFIAFPRPVPDLASQMEQAGYDCLSGWIQDRFGQDFSLKTVDPDHPLHLQFPVAAAFSADVLLADTRREVLVQNRVYVEGRSFCPAPPLWDIRVDAYKWTNHSPNVENNGLLGESKPSPAAEYHFVKGESVADSNPNTLIHGPPFTVLTCFPPGEKNMPRFRFIHIPKTAGTTIFKIVRQWFPRTNRIIAWHKLQEETQLHLDDENIVFGHVPLRHLSIANSQDALWFTILRNPMDQAISCYYEHARNSSRRSPREQELIGEGLESLLLSGKFAYIWPSSVRFLSSLPNDADEREAVESAKQNLRKFTAVGFYDELELFINQMAAALDQPPPNMIPHANYNSSKPEVLGISSEALEAMEQTISLDVELYNYARLLFGRTRTNSMRESPALLSTPSPQIDTFLSLILEQSDIAADNSNSDHSMTYMDQAGGHNQS